MTLLRVVAHGCCVDAHACAFCPAGRHYWLTCALCPPQLSPPPPINFIEWDGLVRLCFNRKNKTLGAIFRAKSVLRLIADNIRAQRALEGGIGAATSLPGSNGKCAAATGANPFSAAGVNPFAAAGANPFASVGAVASSMDVEVDEEEDAVCAGATKGDSAFVRPIVDQVLQSTGFAEQRASKMDLDDFTLLLARFNEAGIHFHGSLRE